jgi:hypothetical protein
VHVQRIASVRDLDLRIARKPARRQVVGDLQTRQYAAQHVGEISFPTGDDRGDGGRG